MSIREGRGRSRRDYPSRPEERSHHGRGHNPPSRHLWIGNLSHDLTESALAHHFLQFGELESIAFQPGRSYAFINYRNEEEAFTAVKELQGFVIGGNPLRIEFAKAEKSLIPSRDADYSERRDDPHSKGRGSPFSQRDSRTRYSSPELSHSNKSKMNDKDAEPSEVLWIGFPAQLKVDEFVLRKAFSPFGEIEKITAFPGRTYAFVRYGNVLAARRAKETLHGKLFGNPRVHICFAKNDSGTSNRDRNSLNASPSPRSFGRSGSYDHFRSDRSFGGMSEGPSNRSPHFIPNLDRGDPDVMGLARNNIWPGGNDVREERRFLGHRSEVGLHRDIYEHPGSPLRNRGDHRREFSPENFPRQGPFYDDPWDLPEDLTLLHGTKKLKTHAFPTENELPEYPFSDLEKAKTILPIPQSRVLDKNHDSRHSGYRPIPERLVNTPQQFAERGDRWNASHDDFQVGPVSLPPPDRRRLTPDLHESSSKEVWKWEGMIAKGGTSVCRACCFPVGRPPDMILPEYLDCTARTSLDMLAKHYYQAASAWVVFFVPANDHDISYYNEFMNYLGEKQRAAVVKVDERTTLFLVPPSEFSEKVLKVPGKLSISGVLLRLDPSGSSYGSIAQNENRETSFTSFQTDLVYQKQISPSGPYLQTPQFTNYEKPGVAVGNTTFAGSAHSISNMQAQGHDYIRKPASGTNWVPHDLQNSNLIAKNITSQASNAPIGQPYSTMPRQMQEAAHSNYAPDFSGVPSTGNGKFPVEENPPIPSNAPNAGIPAEQLAQLASSLLGQQGQLSGISNTAEYKPSGNINQSGYSFRMPQNYGLQNDQVSPEFPPTQFGQLQQLQQQSPDLVASQRDVQAAAQVNQQFQNPGQDDAEADPQKRLQATLQLAAALLQQIQHGKGN